jgi:hypothetical protein
VADDGSGCGGSALTSLVTCIIIINVVIAGMLAHILAPEQIARVGFMTPVD